MLRNRLLSLVLLAGLAMPAVEAQEDRAAKLAAAYQKSVELVKSGKSKDAFKLLGRILGIDPEHVPARTLRARLLHQAGRREPALADAEALLALDPANKVALAIRKAWETSPPSPSPVTEPSPSPEAVAEEPSPAEEAPEEDVEMIASADFAVSDAVESLGAKGWTTLVMVTSPG